VHEYLDKRKLCAKWVPLVLSINQKQQRVDDLEQCLAIFNRNNEEFFRQYISMDETWLLHYTPESNRQSDKACKDATVSWQGDGISILGCAW
jgi:hypothetical protein